MQDSDLRRNDLAKYMIGASRSTEPAVVPLKPLSFPALPPSFITIITYLYLLLYLIVGETFMFASFRFRPGSRIGAPCEIQCYSNIFIIHSYTASCGTARYARQQVKQTKFAPTHLSEVQIVVLGIAEGATTIAYRRQQPDSTTLLLERNSTPLMDLGKKNVCTCLRW
jgi:hypothetical protein